ncbi:flavodoxin family protein [Saccharothrix syringae]|uniref:Flavodoxin family protein n=1 Tax=Saccharothrix syringae TaxID=103733 RepID=A0A5Q0GZJ1_SACSY|nr:flavodoxin family protein [Saccharothrix syringae]QFZ18812.1 flavodoxin family protein [Saccharothrix syringae]
MSESQAMVAIAYHSGFGHTVRLAEAVRDGAASVPGTGATTVNVDGMTEEQWELLDASDAIIFGSPTYMGSASPAFHTFAYASGKRWVEQRWAGKVAAGFTNSSSKSGDKLHTLHYFTLLAAQHGMHWVNLGLMPGWNESTASENDLNRLGVWLGAAAQSNGDEAPAEMSKSDLLTASHLGKRVAEHVQLLRRARQAA